MALADWRKIGLPRMSEMRARVILPIVRTDSAIAAWRCGIRLFLCLAHYSS